MKTSASIVEVKASRLPHGLGLPLPQYQSEEAAGMDLLAAVPLTTPVRLLPGQRQLVATGLSIEIPRGFEGQVRPRSGLALNHGVTVLNAPGTIDSDYRGEVKVLLVNLGRETFVITRGQRIAQLVIQAVARAEIIDVRAVAASRRGDAGFGSTGMGGGADGAKTQVQAPHPVAAVAAAAQRPAVKPAPKPPAAPMMKAVVPAAKVPAAPAAKAAKPPAAPPKTSAPPQAKGNAAKPSMAKTGAGKEPPAKAAQPKAQPAKKPAAKPQPAKRPAPVLAKAKATARA
jgi:dUTP pyrophosphatase